MKLKELRKSKGLKQNYVAKELGVTRQWFAKMESGNKQLSKLQKEKLSKIFNLSIEDFEKVVL